MKVLVAGASGYLGGRITEYLVRSGHEVYVLLRKVPLNSEGWQKGIAKFIVGDICQKKIIGDVVQGRLDAVVYTVSLNQKKSEENLNAAVDTNVTSLWRLLSALKGNSCVKRFVYFSTQQVYGKFSVDSVTENQHPTPINNYGLTHLMCEEICRMFNRQNPSLRRISLRLSNGFGAPSFSECDCWWLVINDFCRMALADGLIHLRSDGSPQRDFIHISDICRAVELILSLDNEQLGHNIYNLGSGITHTILELAMIVAECVQEKFRKNIKVIVQDKEVTFQGQESLIELPRMKYNINRLQSLGFSPRMSLREGIFEVLEYLKNQQVETQ
jgi:UDP-glucose 4-epimerase